MFLTTSRPSVSVSSDDTQYRPMESYQCTIVKKQVVTRLCEAMLSTYPAAF